MSNEKAKNPKRPHATHTAHKARPPLNACPVYHLSLCPRSPPASCHSLAVHRCVPAAFRSTPGHWRHSDTLTLYNTPLARVRAVGRLQIYPRELASEHVRTRPTWPPRPSGTRPTPLRSSSSPRTGGTQRGYPPRRCYVEVPGRISAAGCMWAPAWISTHSGRLGSWRSLRSGSLAVGRTGLAHAAGELGSPGSW